MIIAALIFRPKYFLLIFSTLNVLAGPVDFLLVRLRKKLLARKTERENAQVKMSDLNG